MNNTLLIVAVVTAQAILWGWHGDDNKDEIITAIQDNGCSKQAQIELSQTKSNADVYNYAALSTSY